VLRTWKTSAAVSVLLALAGLLALTPATEAADKDTKLTGAGSTFVEPIMKQWAADYTRDGGSINYQGLGSGAGKSLMVGRKVDFGCTDAVMTKKELSDAAGPVLHIPLVMGGIVPVYNLPGVKEDLNFTPEVLADIYMGKITKWNDDQIKAVNKGVKLPDLTIAPIHRSDASGSTAIFTEFLSKAEGEPNKTWAKTIKYGTSVSWPDGIGTGEKGNPGVAGAVGKNEGSLGYVELEYALRNKLQYGAVRNKTGKFVKASLESVTAAADSSLKTIPEDLRFSLIGAPGPDAYPVSGTVWAVVYVKQEGGQGKALADFFTYIIHDGQKVARERGYAPLPEGLVKLTEKKIEQLRK
jgi:phosphate transport system substrate-binding protein